MGPNASPATGNPATTSPLTTGIARFMTWLYTKGSSPEIEQAILRLMFASGIVFFFAFLTFLVTHDVGLWTEAEQQLAIGLMGYWLAAIGIVASFFVWPAKSVARRIAGILVDVGIATLYLWFAGANGVWMIPAYLFIIFGNGFRYGRVYLFACQALSVVGWAAAGFFVPYWQEHSAECAALLATLALVPLYISVLLGRIKQVQVRTEQALKECLERHAT